jgi:hypothetical protein
VKSHQDKQIVNIPLRSCRKLKKKEKKKKKPPKFPLGSLDVNVTKSQNFANT